MRYLFGDYCLDTQRYELHRGTVPIPLRPKVYQVLAYLLTHADQVVLKQELLEHVWPGQFVGDAALNSYIMDIRKALGDDGDAQRLLRTVRRRGYRFVAPVEVQDQAPAAPPSCVVHAPTGETAPPPALPAADPTGPAAPYADGEHKLVTILCGTLAEAPALATRLGPERWYRLLQTVVGLAQEVLQHYAGTLTLATSEGFTAVFGMPVAQEDHARRAVLAALDLRQRLRDAPALRALRVGADLTLGMGLHSGLVVVGGLGQDPPRLATAVGAPFHIATRLQQQAAPGMILLSAATYHLVHAEVRAAPYGTLTLDGQATPVSVYVVQGLLRRQAGVVGRGPRAQSPFVGRERELALLQDHLALAMGGQGQVIGVVGEPGMGKTRLLAEFCRRVPEAQVTVYEGRCLSYGQATPYLPVRDVVRQVCGLMEGDEVAGHTAAVQRAAAREWHDGGGRCGPAAAAAGPPGGTGVPGTAQFRGAAGPDLCAPAAPDPGRGAAAAARPGGGEPTLERSHLGGLVGVAGGASGGVGGAATGDLSAGVSARLGGTHRGDAGRRAALARSRTVGPSSRRCWVP